jgi:hypothetical protein
MSGLLTGVPGIAFLESSCQSLALARRVSPDEPLRFGQALHQIDLLFDLATAQKNCYNPSALALSFNIIMSCCGGSAPVPPPSQALPYKYLFKYIIVGDTGTLSTAPSITCFFFTNSA